MILFDDFSQLLVALKKTPANKFHEQLLFKKVPESLLTPCSELNALLEVQL